MTSVTSNSDIISNMAELSDMFQSLDISSFDKIRIYYKNIDKNMVQHLPLINLKKNARFAIMVSYDNITSIKYADLLGKIIADAKSYNPADYVNDPEMLGFKEYMMFAQVVQLEMAIYNIDNNTHAFKITEIDEVNHMFDVISAKYNDWMDALAGYSAAADVGCAEDDGAGDSAEYDGADHNETTDSDYHSSDDNVRESEG